LASFSTFVQCIFTRIKTTGTRCSMGRAAAAARVRFAATIVGLMTTTDAMRSASPVIHLDPVSGQIADDKNDDDDDD
jgi:hypothetical protein